MSINNSTQKESSFSAFAGIGTIAGGTVGYCAINKHYNTIAGKTVQVFDGTLKKPDIFIKRNGKILTDAANSTKGFFGKINKLIGENAQASSWVEKIEQGATEVVTEYRTKAAKCLDASGLSGKALQDGIKELSNGKIAKDIAKSIKHASKDRTLAFVLGAAVAGTLLFNGIAKSFKKPKAAKCECTASHENQKAKSDKKQEDKKTKSDARK